MERKEEADGPVNTVREVFKCSLFHEGQNDYRVEVVLSGALYRMVRNIVGFCESVATNKVSLDLLDQLLLEGANRKQNPTKSAPPEGLCLERVYYKDYGGNDEDWPLVSPLFGPRNAIS